MFLYDFFIILNFDWPPFSNSTFLLFLYFLISLQPLSFLQSLLCFHINRFTLPAPFNTPCPMSPFLIPGLFRHSLQPQHSYLKVWVQDPHMRENTQCLSLWVWLATLSIIFSNSIHFSCRFHFSLMLSKIQLCEWFMIVTCLFYN